MKKTVLPYLEVKTVKSPVSPRSGEKGKVMEWQPIETAPKDGRDVLVYREGGFDGFYSVAFWGELTNAWWSANGEELLPPTHWMPLPDPPEQNKPET